LGQLEVYLIWPLTVPSISASGQLETILVRDFHAVQEALGPRLVALHPVEDAGDVAGRVNQLTLALQDEGVLKQPVVLGPCAFLLYYIDFVKYRYR